MNLQNHWFTRSLNVQINNVGLQQVGGAPFVKPGCSHGWVTSKICKNFHPGLVVCAAACNSGFRVQHRTSKPPSAQQTGKTNNKECVSDE